MKKSLKPINSDKFKSLIREHGTVYKVSETLGYGRATLSSVISRGTIADAMADHIESKLGIKFDDYKPEEPKPEPEPKPDPETKIVTRDEMFMKSVVAMLAEICNNQRAMSGKIDELIRLWGED